MSIPATLSELTAAVRDLMADGRAWSEPDLVDALEQRGLDLGSDPEDVVYDLLAGDDVPLAWPVADDRHVLLPALLRDRTFTHKVGAAEIARGYLDVSPDLEPVSLLPEDETFRRLVDGTAIVEAIPGYDDALLAERGITADELPEPIPEAIWLLAPETLQRIGATAGDLVGLTVRAEGFELERVASVAAVGDASHVAGRLRTLVDDYDGPIQIGDAVWQVCADDDGLFSTPQAPLTEVLETAGLTWEGEQVAPPDFDFARWRSSKRVHRIAETHRLDDDEALAVLTLSRLYEQVAAVFEYAQDAVDSRGEDALDELFAEEPPTDAPDEGAPAKSPAGQADAPDQDKRLVRDMLELVDSPAVAEALFAETIGAGREGAAALGLFAETLEPQAPRSARGSLRWLRGKALERMGSVLEAEEAYRAAVSMDDDCAVALFELARLASDRGDAEAGLSYLRRAGAPADDYLRVLLERFRPVERTDIGRNDRCWCGSGRKYKVCHRNRETLPLAERAAWLYQKAGAYLTDGPWRSRALEVAEQRALHWNDPDALWQAVQDPLVGDAVLFEGGAFEAFVEERGTLLPDDELLLAQQWLLAQRSVHEVEQVTPGEGVIVRDVRTGDRLEVRERTASRALRPGMLICARLVPAGDTVQCFGGVEPVALHEREELISLLDGEPAPEELVAALSRRFAPPTLQNTEGEPMVLCEATLRTDDVSSLTAFLDETYDRVEGEATWHEQVVTHGLQRVRATLTVTGDEVRVETNSEARMNRVLARLQDGPAGVTLVEQTRRPAEEVQEAMSRAPGRAPDLLDPSDTEVATAIADLVRQYERAWLDESIPALSGATPREAAADPTRRGDLVRLLDSFPDTGSSPGAMSADRLRQALGL